MDHNRDKLFDQLDLFCTKNQLIPYGSHIILGLSGGPDSMFLLAYLAYKKAHDNVMVRAAHLDHQWRHNSYEDLLFCKEVASQYDIPFIGAKASDIGFKPQKSGSPEDHGRRLRRHFFEQIRIQNSADSIALAHQYDDQQENFFIRLVRGSSLAGLTGIKARADYYIRPLLQIPRSHIIAWLDHHTIPYLIDPTNSNHSYLRNRIRHTVLPALKVADKRFDTTFATTLDSLQESNDYIEKQAQEYFAKMQSGIQDEYTIALDLFKSLHPIVKKQILIIWLCQAGVSFTPTRQLLQEIIRFLEHPTKGIHTIYPTWAIEKRENRAHIITML